MTDVFFRILALCLVTTAFCLVVRQKNSEYALLISVAAGVCIMLVLVRYISVPLNQICDKLEEYSAQSEYFKVALKAVGIGYVTSFIADACRDSGQTSLALKAELAGKCAIFLLSVPLILSLLEMAVGFAK